MRLWCACAVISLTFSSVVSAQDASLDYTEPYQRKALEIYRTAIGYRTAAGHGQVPALARYLADQFRSGGFPEEDIQVLPLTLESGEEVAGLVVRYRGDGLSGKKPILLIAHMDVVEALSQDWERDPFTLIEEDGYFFGRGTADNKAAVAILTATFLRMMAAGWVPTRDLVMGFTGDEETDQMTTRALVTSHRVVTDSEFALNADAGGGSIGPNWEAITYSIQTSEKTYATFELTARNPGGHSSMPRVDNAIYELATALKQVEVFRFPVKTNETTLRYLAESAKANKGELGAAMQRFAANSSDEWAADVLARNPSFVGVTRTTCVATMLRAGHAENALPQSATATINCRIFPGVSVGDVEATLRNVIGNEGVELRVLGEPTASPASDLRDDVFSAVKAAVEARYPGTPILPYMAPYGTDGLEVRNAGIPTYGVSGLFTRDSDDFSHGLNERVPVRSFFGALEHWHIILTELGGPRPTIGATH